MATLWRLGVLMVHLARIVATADRRPGNTLRWQSGDTPDVGVGNWSAEDLLWRWFAAGIGVGRCGGRSTVGAEQRCFRFGLLFKAFLTAEEVHRGAAAGKGSRPWGSSDR